MKKISLYIFNFVSVFWRLIPSSFRINFLTALFVLDSRGKDKSKSLKYLFYVKDRLDWVINERALSFGKGEHPKHKLINYHSFFIDNIKDGENVLDVGCGYGSVARSLAKKKPRSNILAIDYDQKKLDQALSYESIKNLTFKNIDATKSLPDGIWDVIVLSNVLEHIKNRNIFLKKIIKNSNCKKVLIRVPSFERSWEVPMRKNIGMYYFSDNDHKIEHTVVEFEEEMKKANLVIKEMRSVWGEIWAVCKVN